MSGVLPTFRLASLVPDYRRRAPLQRCITGGYELYVLGENELLRLPSLRDLSRGDQLDPPFTVFRSKFDAWFAAEAEEAGAELFTETLVEDLLWEDGRVAGVHTRRGDLRARVVVGADGVNSTVAEKAGLGRETEPDNVSLIVREILDLPAERIEERFALRPGEGVLSLFYGTASGALESSGHVLFGAVHQPGFSLLDGRDPVGLAAGLRVCRSMTCWQSASTTPTSRGCWRGRPCASTRRT